METIIIVSSIVVGGFAVATGGLVCFAKYLTNKLNVENEDKMNEICNKIADKIESDMKKMVE